MADFVSTYLGEFRLESEHLRSGTKIITDAPVDNGGKGSAFSPTDLVSTALANCMVTIMSLKAEQMGINMDGTRIEISKIMVAEPRRIKEIKIVVHMPKHDYTEKDKKIFKQVAETCPVGKSLHPDVVQNVQFVW